MDYVPDYLRVYHCIYVFQVTSAYTNASTLYTNVPLLDGLCSRLPQRIPMHLRYTLTVPQVRLTMFQVTSAYTNASTLYTNVPLLDGLCSRLPQPIPMHLLHTVNVPSLG